MNAEDFLSKELQKFSIIDIALVKFVYLLISIIIATNYKPLLEINWLFYLIFTIIPAFPLWLHLFSSPGTYLQKVNHYIKTNKPAYQVLLFLSMFFFACLLCVLIPFLSDIAWWWYLIVAIILAIKPMKSSFFW